MNNYYTSINIHSAFLQSTLLLSTHLQSTYLHSTLLLSTRLQSTSTFSVTSINIPAINISTFNITSINTPAINIYIQRYFYQHTCNQHIYIQHYFYNTPAINISTFCTSINPPTFFSTFLLLTLDLHCNQHFFFVLPKILQYSFKINWGFYCFQITENYRSIY